MNLLRSLCLLSCAVAACVPVSAFAQAPEIGDGIINIVDDPEVTQGDFYADVRGWNVFSGSTDEGFAFCAAEMETPGLTWRFGYDKSPQWQIAIKHRFSGETPYGLFDVDGRQLGISGWGSGDWVILWPHKGEYDAIASGNRMEIRVGEVWYEMQLQGTAAAALKVQECVTNRGNPDLASAGTTLAQPVGSSSTSMAGAPQMPDPNRRGEQFVGNCQTDYASYRCMAATLTPTIGNGRAELVYDPSGSEFSYIIQTDKNDLSQVWVEFGGQPYRYMGSWNSDGRCYRPMADQDAQVVVNLGHDAWSLCIQ
ncbi:hypothetical protein BD830_10755 [Maritimibacter alkaliphilus HTCC2654]|uniref:hypothetical protein n=1 Tax=Maritimibacter alkaliphilus TaxID=404236 RepID=UPI00032501D2|nr:hypothetical protein [Maritimibacter alkaliphilus]TYP80504.1 hypothetical protein BD830_10755 [Maritimibacter alkaliphilus HTCC2654]